jgi:VacB/RNase II family 3'-5' exoribonuclease
MKEPIHSSIDLHQIARREMLREGFIPDLPGALDREVEALDEGGLAATQDQTIRDLRSLLWSSIDNQESLDLDQVEVAERLADGGIRICVGIADVDAYVAKGSATDRQAAENTTSVYTGIETFPMLPERLSTNLTSLLEGVDRLAVVIDFTVASDETTQVNDIYRALIRNYAKLGYESVGLWLEGQGQTPEKVASVAGLEEQLRLQDEATERLRNLRRRNGALDFETVEASPVMSDGKVRGLTVKRKSRARYLIENLMVTANIAMAAHLEKQGSPAIQRVVRKPERWPRIVEIAESFGDSLPPEPDARALADFLARRKAQDTEHFPDLSLSIVKLLGPGEYVVVPAGAPHDGHFGLAAQDYTHSTAPNRRYIDLVTQRLVKATAQSAAVPYTESELADIAAHCEERQSAARKVERFMRKVIAAEALSGEIGKVFEAIVTGVSAKGTFARLLSPPAEGRIVRGESGLDVGDKIKVRLLATEPQKGFIDFERAPR